MRKEWTWTVQYRGGITCAICASKGWLAHVGDAVGYVHRHRLIMNNAVILRMVTAGKGPDKTWSRRELSAKAI